MSKVYRRKVEEIRALQWTGNNNSQMDIFCEHRNSISEYTNIGSEIIQLELKIRTPMGVIHANPGDYVIKKDKGQFYAFSDSYFKYHYEEVIDAGV